jgi:disulfide bond formation protein DsbB
MVAFQRFLNLLFIYTLCAVLLGSYAYQYIRSEEPCSLCLLQRLGVIGMMAALLLNVRFGIKVQHYGLVILSALLGRMVSLRQIGLHVCPEFPTFGEPVLGFDLYVWSFIVFSASIFASAILIILYGVTKNQEFAPRFGVGSKFAFWVVFLTVISNFLTTFMECGLTPCI